MLRNDDGGGTGIQCEAKLARGAAPGEILVSDWSVLERSSPAAEHVLQLRRCGRIRLRWSGGDELQKGRTSRRRFPCVSRTAMRLWKCEVALPIVIRSQVR